MKTASISATKNQLSALIEQVRQGESILITDHDRPVARLTPVAVENGQSSSDELALLERKGVLGEDMARPAVWHRPLCLRSTLAHSRLCWKNASRRDEILG
jgi:prevent-host-death family protein